MRIALLQKFKNIILTNYYAIINLGIREGDSTTEIKRIKLLNLFCIAWHVRTILEFIDDDLTSKPLLLSLFDFFIMVLIVGGIQFLQYKRKLLTARLLFICSILFLTFMYANYIYTANFLEYYFMLVPGTTLIFIDNKKINWVIIFTAFIFMYFPNFYFNHYSAAYSNFSIIFLFFGVLIMVNYFKNLNLKNEKALEIKSTELEELDKFKSQFFTNISHEIRTPLTLIKGQADDLKNLSSKDVKIEAIQQNINQQINSITEIVDNVLDLAKMKSSNFKLKTKHANISDLIEKIYLSFESLFYQKNIDFDLSLNSKNYITNIDPIFIERALNNILLNALKYTEKGSVTLDVSRKKQFLNITVSDTGIGISKNNMENIFNRFYQVNNDINQSGGSGIGLAFSKEIIELHEGTLTAKSKPNIGSSFIITLPLTPKKTAQETPIKTSSVTNNLLKSLPKNNIESNTVFLIVDDNLDMRKYLKSILQNYTCLEAKNGIEALEIVQNRKVDFIITDYMMPKMNGLTLITNLNKRKNRIPIIMLTAKNDIDSKLEVLNLGIDDYVTKPFEKEELLIRINNAIKNYRNKVKYNEENNLDTFRIPKEKDLLKEIELHVNNNSDKKELNQDFLSEKFNISKSSLYRHIKSKTGMSPKEFITEIRLQKARRILENNSDILLKQLALEVGFQHTSYFSTIFTNRFGYKPLKKETF